MSHRNGDAKSNPKLFLGEKLAKARIAAGFSSQNALAAKLGFDRTVVTKAETGERVPTLDVLAAWCAVCGLDAELFADVAELARASDGPVPTWFESWLEAESAAHILRYWSPIIVPALFETADYRRAVIMAGGSDPERADALVTATLNRQRVLTRADPPEVIAVIRESVLHSLIGSPQIMYDQLSHLVTMTDRPNISIHVVPSGVGAHAGLSGDLSLASGDGTPDVLHTDAIPEGHTTEMRSIVRRAAVTFERVRRVALPCVQSCELIVRTAEEVWKNQLQAGVSPAIQITAATASKQRVAAEA
jgi:transcriptional regulator with XRE-family HTH domain